MTDEIQDLLAKGKFDPLAAIKGRKYPEKDVEVYFDSQAMFERNALEAQIAVEKDPDVVNDLEKIVAEKVEAIRASRLTFTLRGLSNGLADAIAKKAALANPEDQIALIMAQTYGHIAASIVKVTNADGEEGTTVWDEAAVEALWEYLPQEEFGKLTQAVNEVSFSAFRFEEKATSPDFS